MAAALLLSACATAEIGLPRAPLIGESPKAPSSAESPSAASPNAAPDPGAEPPRAATRQALDRASAPSTLGQRRASGAPDARDRAVWAACRPQVIAERCMAYEPTSAAMAEAFGGWRARNAKELTALYSFIAERGGLFFGDIDRTPLTTRFGDARSQTDVTHQNVMLRYCENAERFFNDDPRSNLTFPTVAEAYAEASRQSGRGGAGPDDGPRAASVRAACETPLPS